VLYGVNSQCNSASSITTLQGGYMRNLGSIPDDEKRSYSASIRHDWLWDTPSLFFKGDRLHLLKILRGL